MIRANRENREWENEAWDKQADKAGESREQAQEDPIQKRENGQTDITGKNGNHIELISIIGEIEGHENLSGNTKITTYGFDVPNLVEIEKIADPFAEDFARKHLEDKLHYFVGAGCLYGATYSYAMCYWEEMHWIRTKSIHSAEFFHGMLEIVDKDTPVTVFVGEDAQRPLGLRVAKFLPQICENFTIIDTHDYPLEGIDEKYRGRMCYAIMHAVTNRIDAHVEAISGHDMAIRRYYRKLAY